MKKWLVALMASFALMTAAPQKADAGVALFLTGALQSNSQLYPGVYVVHVGAVTATIGLAMIYMGSGDSNTVGIALALLDGESLDRGTDLEKALSAKYSFVDSPEVLSDLANAIRARYLGLSEGKTMIRLPESEVRSILEFSTLSDAQIDLIANDLK